MTNRNNHHPHKDDYNDQEAQQSYLDLIGAAVTAGALGLGVWLVEQGEVRAVDLPGERAPQLLAGGEQTMLPPPDGAVILKFWLHLERKEQKKRFKRLLKDPDFAWRVGPAERRRRKQWDQYAEAVEGIAFAR